MKLNSKNILICWGGLQLIGLAAAYLFFVTFGGMFSLGFSTIVAGPVVALEWLLLSEGTVNGVIPNDRLPVAFLMSQLASLIFSVAIGERSICLKFFLSFSWITAGFLITGYLLVRAGMVT